MTSEPVARGTNVTVENIIAKIAQTLDQLALVLADLVQGEKARALAVVPVQRPVKTPRRRSSRRR